MLLTPHIVRHARADGAGSLVDLYRHAAEHRPWRAAAADRAAARWRWREPAGRFGGRRAWWSAQRRCAWRGPACGYISAAWRCRWSAGGVPGVAGVPSGTGNAPPANPPLLLPVPAGTVPPPFQGEGGQAPGSVPAVGQVPGAPTVGLQPPGGAPSPRRRRRGIRMRRHPRLQVRRLVRRRQQRLRSW